MTDSSFTRSEIPSLAEMNLDDSSEVYDEEDESLSEFSYQEMNAKRCGFLCGTVWNSTNSDHSFVALQLIQSTGLFGKSSMDFMRRRTKIFQVDITIVCPSSRDDADLE